ncbi:MAG: type II secretion system F family protein, partial [bacterium]
MPKYKYEVIVNGTDVKTGVMEAASSAALAASLQKKGMMVISVEEHGSSPETGKGSSAKKKKKDTSETDGPPVNQEDLPWYKRDLTFFEGDVKLEPLLLFTSQLSSLIGAGVHLLKALSGMAKDTEDKQLKKILEQVKTDVEQGLSLSAAIAKHPKAFSSIYVNLVKAAEATGELDVILDKLTVYLEKSVGLRRKVKSAMTYPIVVLSIATIAIAAILIKIIPAFESTYADLGAELPAVT